MKKILFIVLLLLLITTGYTYASTPYIFNGGTSGALQVWGDTSHASDVGFQLITRNTTLEVCQLNWTMDRNNNPTDDVYARIYEGGTNLTSGTLRYTSNAISATSMSTTSATLLSFYFGDSGGLGFNCPALKTNTVYWFDVTRTVPSSTTGYIFEYNGGNTSPYTSRLWTQRLGIFSDWYGSPAVYSPAGALLGYGASGTQSGILNLSFTVPQMNCGSLQDICNGLTNSLNYVISLIVPTQIDLASLDTLKTTLNNKAPFAYINTVLGYNTTNPATSSALPTFSIPINGSVTLPNTPHISFNASVPSQASGIFTSIRAITTIIFWLFFGGYIIGLARKVFD